MEIETISIIISILGLLGTIATVYIGIKKSTQEAASAQARMDEQLKALTREVRKHNNFAERMPVLEEKIDVANHRIKDLEEINKGV